MHRVLLPVLALQKHVIFQKYFLPMSGNGLGLGGVVYP